MPDITLEVRGLDDLIRRFGKRDVARRPIVKALGQSGKVVRSGVLAPYDTPKPGSTYRRTGTLGRKLTVRVDSGPLEARIGTRLSYGPYVIGDSTQAPWMRHWKTIGKVGEEAMPRIEGFFVTATDEIAKDLTEG